MKVGIDCQVFGAGVRHGFTTYLGNLLEALRRRYPANQFVAWPCTYHAGWRMPHQLWRDQGEIPWRAWRDGVDVIHAPAFSGAVWRRQPLVLTVHDLLYLRHPDWLPAARARWYWARWIPLTARRASAVIAPSEATKQDLITLAGVAPDRITVIPHAVDPLFARRLSEDSVREYRARKGLTAPYVLYVGAIDRRKDWRGLLEACALLRRTHGSVRLVIAGHVSGRRSDLEASLGSAGLGDGVVLVGHVPDAELPALYAGAAVFVYPSWWEGFGLPPLEAMAMGVPVIAYRTSSLPEVLEGAGLLLDAPCPPATLAAAMQSVLDDQSLRQSLIDKGRRQAARFSWRRAAEQTMAVYERCLSR